MGGLYLAEVGLVWSFSPRHKCKLCSLGLTYHFHVGENVTGLMREDISGNECPFCWIVSLASAFIGDVWGHVCETATYDFTVPHSGGTADLSKRLQKN